MKRAAAVPVELRQRDAIERTIAALDGRLLPEHDALLELCRGLAVELDGESDERGRAALWREYRSAVAALLEIGTDSDDDGEAAFLDAVSTPVGDAKNAKSSDARAGARKGRGDARAAADAVAAAGRGRRPRAAS